MKEPIKLVVVNSITGRGLSIRCLEGGTAHEVRDALAAAGYKAGDVVELVPEANAERLGEVKL